MKRKVLLILTLLIFLTGCSVTNTASVENQPSLNKEGNNSNFVKSIKPIEKIEKSEENKEIQRNTSLKKCN